MPTAKVDPKTFLQTVDHVAAMTDPWLFLAAFLLLPIVAPLPTSTMPQSRVESLAPLTAVYLAATHPSEGVPAPSVGARLAGWLSVLSRLVALHAQHDGRPSRAPFSPRTRWHASSLALHKLTRWGAPGAPDVAQHPLPRHSNRRLVNAQRIPSPSACNPWWP